MNKVRLGWSEISLVPTGRKVNLVGQFYERITDEIADPIVVTAMAIECGGEEAIFCSCDLVSTSRTLLLGVRERLEKIEGFPADKLRQTVAFIKEVYGTFDFSCKQYDELYALMLHDKKNVGTEIRFTLLAAIGDIRIDRTATKEEIFEMLDFVREC